MKSLHRLLASLLAIAAANAWGGSCTLSVGAIVFAPYQPILTPQAMSTDRTSDTALTLTCTGIVRGGPYAISLLSGDAGSGAARAVRHVGGQAPLVAVLYRDPGFVQPWGDGGAGSMPITGMLPPGDSRQTHVVFGRLPAGQRQLLAGTYSAVWQVRLEYTP